MWLEDSLGLPSDRPVHVELVKKSDMGDWRKSREPKGGEHAVAAKGSDSVESNDVRTLAVDYDAHGERFKEWRMVCQEMWHQSFPDTPLEGPATVLHLCKHMQRHGPTPETWLDKWCGDRNILHTDRVYYELKALVQAIEFAGSYDQLNLASLVSMEILARRAQTIFDAYAVNPSKPNFESA
eukprot:9351518-Karenia_brevis.AAC.1